MQIKYIKVRGVRNFDSDTTIDLSESSSKLITMFGKNGSGKTTLMKCALLLQQLAFFSSLQSKKIEKYQDNLIEIIYKTVGDNDDWVVFGTFYAEKEYNVYASCANSESYVFHDDIEWVRSSDRLSIGSYYFPNNSRGFVFLIDDKVIDFFEENEGDLESMGWVADAPRNIIGLIEAGRTYSTDSITLSKIDLSNINGTDFLLDVVFRPFDAFSTIYNRVINDYLYQRINPQVTSAYLYHNIAKKIFNQLIEDPQIDNFSSKSSNNSISLTAKSKRKNGRQFDVRDFSSGERCLISMLWYLFKANAITALVIDEPENHFHEKLLVNFRKILLDIVSEPTFVEFLKKYDCLENGSEKYYLNHKVDQIFLLTHSKKLIYSNLPKGGVYYIGEQIQQVEYSATEKILRECGLSEVSGRVLFVEGQTDTYILQGLTESLGVKVLPLGNCEAVMSTFERIAAIKDKIIENDFCFLLDSDNRPDDLLTRMMTVDAEFFEKAVVVMDCHEIENNLIDYKIYKNIYEKYDVDFNGYELRCTIRGLADDTRGDCLNKSLAIANDRIVKNWSPKITMRREIKSGQGYDQLLEITRNEFEDIMDKLRQSKEKIEELYSDDSWERDWEKLCDGKRVYGQLINYISRELGIDNKRLKSDIERTISNSLNSTEFNISNIIIKVERAFLG